jgi:hypothetical protein
MSGRKCPSFPFYFSLLCLALLNRSRLVFKRKRKRERKKKRKKKERKKRKRESETSVHCIFFFERKNYLKKKYQNGVLDFTEKMQNPLGR